MSSMGFGTGILITVDGIPNGQLGVGIGSYENVSASSAGTYNVAANATVILLTTGTGQTVNLPAATGSGRKLLFIQVDTGSGATITPNGTDKIEGAATKATTTQYQKVGLIDGASGIWYDLGTGGQ